MRFNSYDFLIFLALVLPVYYALSHRWQNRFLLVASYFFYGWWDWRFCGLLAVSTVVDYFMAQWMADSDDPAKRKRYLIASLGTNLGILGFFKYFNFFVDSAAALLQQAGLEPNLPLLRVILPVGISFYTFQTLAYTIDVYRRQQTPTRDFTAFALYVAYFPQLVAGPIERASRLLPQITAPRRVTPEAFNSGVQLILLGYIKKVVVADGLAPYADAAFGSSGGLTSAQLWLGLYCFAFQIYGDFSGYTDIARGVSRLMGIELMENFRQPYLARNITEFWRRWHISLSTWLRDYLYIPLGGNRKGTQRQYVNLMITMLLGGLWHGANWTFVAWGGVHGAALAVHKYLTRHRKIGLEPVPSSARDWAVYVGKAAATFHLVALAWILFRADSLGAAVNYIGGLMAGLLGAPGGNPDPALYGMGDALLLYGGLILLIDLGCWLRRAQTPLPDRTPWLVRGVVYGAALLLLAFVRGSTSETFIYFQF